MDTTTETPVSPLVRELANRACQGDYDAAKILHDVLVDEGQDLLASYLRRCITHSRCKGTMCDVPGGLRRGTYSSTLLYCGGHPLPTPEEDAQWQTQK